MYSNAWIYIYITLLLFVLGFVFRKSRILFLIILVWKIIIGGLNTYCVDWESNEQIFTNAGNSKSLFALYTQLAVLFKNLNLSFVSFNFWIYLFTTLLIAIVILKLSNNPNVVLAFTLLFPFTDDIIQKRGYPVIGIMVVGFYLYYRLNGSKKGLILFAIFTFLSYQFHSSGIIFFSFILYELIPKKYKMPSMVIYVILGTILRGYYSRILLFLGGNELGNKSDLYFNQLAATSSVTHFIFWIIWQLSFLLIVYYIRKKEPNRFNDFVWNINVWALVILPFYAFNPVFARIFRSVLIFNYIAVSNCLIVKKMKINIYGIVINFLQICLCCVSLYLFDMSSSSVGFEQMILWIFNNNVLLK